MDDVETMSRELRDLLGAANPAPASTLAQAGTTRQAQRLMREITSGVRIPAAEHLRGGLTPPVRTAGRRPSRRHVLLGAAAAGLAAVGLVAQHSVGGAPAEAARPPVLPYSLSQAEPAGPELLDIAAAAAARPAEPAGTYAYVRTASWGLNTATGGGRSTSALASQQNESWLAADGTGLTVRTTGPSMVERIGSQETYDAVLGAAGDTAQTFVYGVEGRTLFPPFDVEALPWEDPARFARVVNRHDTTAVPVAVDTVDAIEQLFTTQGLPPQARQRVWTMLATLPEVSYRGPLRDRLGRAGEAFTVDDDGGASGLPMQMLLIVDPVTGQLLESDQVLTEDPGALNVPVPSVLSVRVVIASGSVSTTQQRP